MRKLPNIVAGDWGKKHWRNQLILEQYLTSFEEKEKRIVKGNGRRAKEYQEHVNRIRKNMMRRPRRHKLGREREDFFDKVIKQLMGQRLRDRVIIGSIAHSSLSFINVVEHIDRSIIVLGAGRRPMVYHFNITGPKWVKKHTREQSQTRICIVPVQLARERDGQPEEVTIEEIKRQVMGFIGGSIS